MFRLKCNGHSSPYLSNFRLFLILPAARALIYGKQPFFQRYFYNNGCGGRQTHKKAYLYEISALVAGSPLFSTTRTREACLSEYAETSSKQFRSRRTYEISQQHAYTIQSKAVEAVSSNVPKSMTCDCEARSMSPWPHYQRLVREVQFIRSIRSFHSSI